MDKEFDFRNPLPGTWGLLGGTFDPIHNGHLYVARTAMDYLKLDGVIFMPNGGPPHKYGKCQATAEQRLKMVRLAIEEAPRLYFSCYELTQNGPNYSFLTLEQLHRMLPQTTKLVFLIGGDSLVQFASWVHPERILEAVPIAAVYRPGYMEAEMERAVKKLDTGRITLIPCPGLAISSSAIRSGTLTEVPEKVASYIKEECLYGYGS